MGCLSLSVKLQPRRLIFCVSSPLVSAELVRMVMSGWESDALLCSGFNFGFIPHPFIFWVVPFVVLSPKPASSYLQPCVCFCLLCLTCFLFKSAFSVCCKTQSFISPVHHLNAVSPLSVVVLSRDGSQRHTFPLVLLWILTSPSVLSPACFLNGFEDECWMLRLLVVNKTHF